jgi:hypothetical protein
VLCASTLANGAPPSPLTAISGVDGRYAGATADLRPWFSEFGLIRQRVAVELTWLQALADEPGIPEVPPLSPAARTTLQGLVDGFSESDAAAVKRIEAVTNHDMKAVEYWLKEKVRAPAERDGGLAPQPAPVAPPVRPSSRPTQSSRPWRSSCTLRARAKTSTTSPGRSSSATLGARPRGRLRRRSSATSSALTRPPRLPAQHPDAGAHHAALGVVAARPGARAR